MLFVSDRFIQKLFFNQEEMQYIYIHMTLYKITLMFVCISASSQSDVVTETSQHLQKLV